jgi:hypothetical protein
LPTITPIISANSWTCAERSARGQSPKVLAEESSEAWMVADAQIRGCKKIRLPGVGIGGRILRMSW